MARGSDKGSKRRRLCSLAALQHINDSQLASVLAAVAGIVNDDELLVSRFAIGRHLQKEARKFGSSISLPLETGGNFEWFVCSLGLLLKHFVSISLWFKEMLQSAIQRCGHNLHLIAYSDELTPGDAFSPDNLRKSWCFYISILEFGPSKLCQMEAWLPIAILRSSVVDKVEDGLPCVYRSLFRSWFCGEPSKLGTEGMVVHLDGEPTLIVFESVIFLSDLDGHRASFAWKGTGSMKPCLKCRNCMKKGHSSCSSSSWQVDITETDYSRLDLATDAEIWEVIDMLKAAHSSGDKKLLQDLEMAHGFRHVAKGLWQDIEMRQFIKPATGVRYDPMHCMYVGGVMGHGIFEFLAACKKLRKTSAFSSLNDFINADWECPFASRGGLAKIRHAFTDKREAASKRKTGIKMMASEQLSVYPMIRRFAEVVQNPALEDHCQCVYAMCDVADALQEAKRQQYDDRESMAHRIKDLIVRYLRVRLAVYGTSRVKPKHHMLLHMFEQLLMDGLMLDCFILEHMHLLIKAYADMVANTIAFEKSITIRAVAERCRQLKAKVSGTRLQGSQVPSPEVSAILQHQVAVGRHLSMASGQELHVEDVIFQGTDRSRCFVIKACLMGDLPYIVLEELELVRVVTSACSKWKRTLPAKLRSFMFEGSKFVQHAHYWSISEGEYEVLHSVWWS